MIVYKVLDQIKFRYNIQRVCNRIDEEKKSNKNNLSWPNEFMSNQSVIDTLTRLGAPKMKKNNKKKNTTLNIHSMIIFTAYHFKVAPHTHTHIQTFFF